MNTKNRLSIIPCLLFLLTMFVISRQVCQAQSPKKWEAPATANDLVNPFINDPGSVAEGKKIFVAMCVICHGETGKGNGVASVAIMPHPANFLSIEIESESDGSIFWKLTNGNPPMAPYKTLLTDDQRWKVVTYIRKLEEKDPSYGKKH